MRSNDEPTVRLGPAADPDGASLDGASLDEPSREGAPHLPLAVGGRIDEPTREVPAEELSEDAGTDLLFLRPLQPVAGRPAPMHRPSGSVASSLPPFGVVETPVTGIPAPAMVPTLLDADLPAMARAFVADAERRIAAGDHAGVVTLAGTLRQAFHRAIESPADVQHRALPWVNLYDGESRLVLGDVDGAVEVLRVAMDGGDGPLRARAAWTLGRALFAAGRRQAAESPLLWAPTQGWVHEAGWSLAPAPVDQVDGMRILAELAAEAGDEARSNTILERAVALAHDAGDVQAAALAHQGQARIATLRGRCAEALDALRRAVDLLGRTPAPSSAAPILLDVAALQALLGRYGPALEYVDAAAAWSRELPALAARAHAQRAEIACRVGEGAAAESAALAARDWVLAQAPRSPEVPLRIGRVLCELGHTRVVLELLDELIEPEPSPAEDPVAALVALRAWAAAGDDPEAASALVDAALARRGPASPLIAAQVRLDAARALVVAGQPAKARSLAKRGVKALQRTGARGLKLELLLLIAELGAEPEAVATIRGAARAMLDELPPSLAAGFSRRAAIAALGL